MIGVHTFRRVFAAVFGVTLAALPEEVKFIPPQGLGAKTQAFNDKLRQRRKSRGRGKPRQGSSPKPYGNNRARRGGFKRRYSGHV